MKKRRGRPPHGRSKLQRQLIIEAAAGLLQADGVEFSMRDLSKVLGVDPMAIYNYFKDKKTLLSATASMLLSELDPNNPPFSRDDNIRERLIALSGAYLGLIRKAPMLMHLLARGKVDGVDATMRFAALFGQAVAGKHFANSQEKLFRNVLVDFLHGYALAPLPASDTSWIEGVDLIMSAPRSRRSTA